MSSKVKYLSSIFSPESLGELIDKNTILEIKQIHMTGIKLKSVDKELKLNLRVPLKKTLGGHPKARKFPRVNDLNFENVLSNK